MLTSGINFTNFKSKVKTHRLRKLLTFIIKEKNQVIESLGKIIKIVILKNKYSNIKNLQILE